MTAPKLSAGMVWHDCAEPTCRRPFYGKNALCRRCQGLENAKRYRERRRDRRKAVPHA
jgi:hypothetical protein